MSLHLFAGLRVRDFQAALPWYEGLFGEPSSGRLRAACVSSI
jgi:hypothetical protein